MCLVLAIIVGLAFHNRTRLQDLGGMSSHPWISPIRLLLQCLAISKLSDKSRWMKMQYSGNPSFSACSRQLDCPTQSSKSQGPSQWNSHLDWSPSTRGDRKQSSTMLLVSLTRMIHLRMAIPSQSCLLPYHP